MREHERAADPGAVEQERCAAGPGAVAEHVEGGAVAVQVAVDARSRQPHRARRHEAAVERHVAGDARQLQVQRIAAHALVVEIAGQSGMVDAHAAGDLSADQAHVAVGLEAAGEHDVARDARAVGAQPLARQRLRALAAAQAQAFAVQVAADRGAGKTDVGTDRAAGIERQVAGDCAALGAQAGQQAVRKTDAAVDPRALESRRRVEHTTEEPQAVGDNAVAQVDAALDPGADDLQPARFAATGARLREMAHEGAAHRKVGMRHDGSAQTDTRDLAVSPGVQQQQLAAAQRLEVVQRGIGWEGWVDHGDALQARAAAIDVGRRCAPIRAEVRSASVREACRRRRQAAIP